MWCRTCEWWPALHQYCKPLTCSLNRRHAMKRMYQIYDIEAGLVSGPIFLEHNDKPAVRNFNTIFTIEGSMPNKFPEHFELRCLGVQDDETGKLQPHDPHMVITNGTEWAANQRIQAAIQQYKYKEEEVQH